MHIFLPILAQTTPNPNAPVTFTIIPSQIITWIIIGLIAGYIANLLIRGRHMSPVVAILLGVLGAFVGSFLFNLLNIQVSGVLTEGILIRWIDILTALVGAIIILFLFHLIFRRR